MSYEVMDIQVHECDGRRAQLSVDVYHEGRGVTSHEVNYDHKRGVAMCSFKPLERDEEVLAEAREAVAYQRDCNREKN